jgi:hypothetical protein
MTPQKTQLMTYYLQVSLSSTVKHNVSYNLGVRENKMVCPRVKRNVSYNLGVRENKMVCPRVQIMCHII